MKGAISSVAARSAGSLVSFEVNEAAYVNDLRRVVTKHNALDGTVLTSNWGAPEGNRMIFLGDLMVTRIQYDLLEDMLEDDDYEFLFNYKNETWRVAIQAVRGRQEGVKMRTTLLLSVVSKYPDGETS